jgi:hypothetical protein
MPARILHDYDPGSDQTEEDWLAEEYDNGWVPEYGHGVPFELNGPLVHRWAMIRHANDDPTSGTSGSRMWRS